MCRFLLYMGKPVTISSLVTDPENSLIKQSYQAKERFEPLNGDGFGIAWYKPDVSPHPAVFKSITPAWNNQNLLNIARVTRSGCILAHVRAATSSQTVSEANCHPFLWRDYAFCHNGDIGGFQKVRRALLGRLSDETFRIINGLTDSEHMFALFVEHLLNIPAETPPLEAMSQALLGAIREAVALARENAPDKHCYMNFAVTNGLQSVVSHCSTDPNYFDSLYIYSGAEYACVKGRTQIISKAHENPDMVIAASEPLTDDPGWRKVGLNKLMVIDADLSVTSREVTFPAAA